MTRLSEEIVQQALEQVASDKRERIARLQTICDYLNTLGNCRLSLNYGYGGSEPTNLVWTYGQYVDVPPHGTTPWLVDQLQKANAIGSENLKFTWTGFVDALNEEVSIECIGEFRDAHAGGW